jgi:hypothetical protein
VQAAPATGLRYVDKTTGSEVRLTPNPQPLVRTHQQDTENAGDLGRDHRLMPVTQRSRGDEYQIFTSPDSESGEDTLATLRNDPRVAMAARFTRSAVRRCSSTRPSAWCNSRTVTPAAALALLRRLQLPVHRQHRSDGSTPCA